MKIKIILFFILFTSLNAQDLKTTINEVISTNPIILERLQNYNATKTNITSAKSGYYPSLNLNLGIGVEKTNKNDASGSPIVLNNGGQYNVYQNWCHHKLLKYFNFRNYKIFRFF